MPSIIPLLFERKNGRVWLFILLANIWAGCLSYHEPVPARFRGEFKFNAQESIAYWDDQSDWADPVKELLVKMARPTVLNIGADSLTIEDSNTGEVFNSEIHVLNIRRNSMVALLHKNFAQKKSTATFLFDEGGFWLAHTNLFPDYRERFDRASPKF